MRLGGQIFLETTDPEELARAHRVLGYRAAFCPNINLKDSDKIRTVREAFIKHDVVIAEAGVWNNLMDPDAAKRKANLRAMVECLALADEVGALCCVNIAGTWNPNLWYAPHQNNFSKDAFDLAVENARAVIDEVKPKRAKFTYEMMPTAIPDSADAYLELIETIARPEFAVHLDIVNIISSPRRYYNNTAIIRECIEKLGPHIMSCHLKDVKLDDEKLTVLLAEVMPGRGGFDIKTYLEGISRLPHQPPVLLEHLATADEFKQAYNYVLGVAKEAGVEVMQ